MKESYQQIKLRLVSQFLHYNENMSSTSDASSNEVWILQKVGHHHKPNKVQNIQISNKSSVNNNRSCHDPTREDTYPGIVYIFFQNKNFVIMHRYNVV